MTKDEYLAFVQFEEEYEEMEDKLEAYFEKLIDKIRFINLIKSSPTGERRHYGSLTDIYFNRESISYYTNCCGGTDWAGSILVEYEAFNPEWLAKLDADYEEAKATQREALRVKAEEERQKELAELERLKHKYGN